MKKIFSAYFAVCSLISLPFASDALAQEANSVISSGGLKDNGVWGFSADNNVGAPLKSTLWQNANSQNLDYLFANITGENGFYPFRILVKRTILSGGIAPKASESTAISRLVLGAKISNPIVTLRALQLSGNLSENPNILKTLADAYFYLGRTEEACSLVQAANADSTDKAILEFRATCYALNGEAGAAQLALDLAQGADFDSKKPNKDFFFARAIAAVSAGVNSANLITDLEFRGDNGRYFALSRKLNLPINEKTIGNFSPQAIAILAKEASPLQPIFLKLAARLGLISIEEYASFAPAKVIKAPVIIEPPIPSKDKNKKDIKKLPPETEAPQFVEPTPPETQILYDGHDLISSLISQKNFDDFWIGAKVLAPLLKDFQNPYPADLDALLAIAIINQDFTNAQRFIEMGAKPFAFENMLLGNNDKVTNVLNDAVIFFGANPNFTDRSILLAPQLAKEGQIDDAIKLQAELALEENSFAESVLFSALALQKQNPKNAEAVGISQILRILRKSGLKAEVKDLAIYTIFARHFDEISPNFSAK